MSESFLDILRNRAAANMQNEALQRFSEFGAGMAATRSPNFFTMLGGGARAQAEGDRTRMEELRRIADLERQQRALDIEEQRRREELALRREEQAANAPLRAAQAEQALAYRDYLRAGGPGAGRGQLSQRDIATIGDRANRFAANQIREPAPNSPEARVDTPEAKAGRDRQRAEIVRQYIAEQYRLLGLPLPAAVEAPPADVRAPPAPAAVIDLRRNPGGNPPR